MFNADVHRRTVNQSGTFRAEGNNLSPAGGSVFFNLHLNTHESNLELKTARGGRTLGDGFLQDTLQGGRLSTQNKGEHTCSNPHTAQQD